jgi:hypothetical protein
MSEQKEDMVNHDGPVATSSVRAMFREHQVQVDVDTSSEKHDYPNVVPASQSMPYGNGTYQYTTGSSREEEEYDAHRIKRTASGGLWMKKQIQDDLDEDPSLTSPTPPLTSSVYGKKTSRGTGHWFRKTVGGVVRDFTAVKLSVEESASKANAMLEMRQLQEEMGILIDASSNKNKRHRNIIKQVFGPPSEKAEVKLERLKHTNRVRAMRTPEGSVASDDMSYTEEVDREGECVNFHLSGVSTNNVITINVTSIGASSSLCDDAAIATDDDHNNNIRGDVDAAAVKGHLQRNGRIKSTTDASALSPKSVVMCHSSSFA